MRILHTRNIKVDEDGLCLQWPDVNTRVEFGQNCPKLSSEWNPECALNFGGQFTWIFLKKNRTEAASWFLNEGMGFLTNEISHLISLHHPADLRASSISSVDRETAVHDLLSFVACMAPHLSLQSLEAPPANHSTIDLRAVAGAINALGAGRSSIFSELITAEILQERALRIYVGDESFEFGFFVPVRNFWYLGVTTSGSRDLAVLITKHKKIAVCGIDIETGEIDQLEELRAMGLRDIDLAEILLTLRLTKTLRVPARDARKVGIVLRESHIGHYIWNELSAVSLLLDNDEAVKPFLLKECSEPVFGIAAVFPSLKDDVVRGAETLSAFLPYALSGEVGFLPFTQLKVPQSLADRLVELSIAQEPDLHRTLQAVRERKKVLLIGLRLENRCWPDQVQGYIALAKVLREARADGFLLIFDGHNVEGGVEMKSYGEDFGKHPDLPSIVSSEIQITEEVRSACADGIDVMSLVPCSIAASIVASVNADYFVTHWGAGLAKYKWVANLPGAIISSKFILESKGDLRIYDVEEFRENAVACDYISPDRVVDRPDLPKQVRTFEDGVDRGNFEVAPEDFASFVIERLRAHALLE